MDISAKLRAGKNSRLVRFAAVGCAHAPKTNMVAVKAAVAKVRDWAPDVFVELGDLQDSSYVGKHPTEDDYTIDEQDEQAATLLRMWRDAAPGADLYRHVGNHEHRRNKPENVSKRIRSRLGDGTALAEETASHWTTLPYEFSDAGILTFGQVATYHGFGGGRGSWMSEVLDVRSIVGWRGGDLNLYAHYHEPYSPEQRKVGQRRLPLWGACVGTLADLKPAYAGAWATNHWGHGVFLGQCWVRRCPHRGREWDGHTVALG